LKALVDLLADGLRQARDFAISCHKNFFFYLYPPLSTFIDLYRKPPTRDFLRLDAVGLGAMIEREQDAQSGTLLCRGAEIPCPPQRHSVFASSLHEDTLAYKVKLSTAKREIFAFFLRQARGERAGAKAGME
jgi:hypothetical protein